MRITVVFIIILSYSGFLQAQSIEKCYQLIQQKQYVEAIDICQKLIQKEKNQIETKFALAKIFGDTIYVKYNFEKAYKNLKFVEKALPNENKNSLKTLDSKFNISMTSVAAYKIQLINTAFQSSITDVIKLNQLIDLVKDDELAKQITETRDELAYNEAKKIDTYQSYDSFIRKYPAAKQLPEAKVLYRQRCDEFYLTYTFDGELSTINEFENKYPYFDYPADKREQDRIVAKMAAQLNLEKSLLSKKAELIEIYTRTNNISEFIPKAAPRELAFIALQRLLEPYIYRKSWDSAIALVKKHEPFFGNKSKKVEELIKILEIRDTVTLLQIGENINTKSDEYVPVITADGRYLYFCGHHRNDNIGGEDIFVSEWVDGKWAKPKILDDLNSLGHEAPVSISSDGNRLIFFNNSRIFYSDKTLSGWKAKQPINEINTEEWEADAMITSDGNAILFVSDRPGAVGHYHKINELYHGSYNGNIDIYISPRNGDSWGIPINLGKTINTPFCDRSPFLHPDMKTLYFSSDGHGGLGGLDIYKCTRLNDTSWTQWSVPVNLGTFINTGSDDWGFKITTDGEIAYFAANRDNDYNIHFFRLPMFLRPDLIATITGKLIDKKTKRPIIATIRWEDLNTGQPIGVATSNPVDGSYFIAVPLGKMYGYFVETDGYYPISNNVDVRESNQSLEINENIEMVSYYDMINDGMTVSIKNLFFDHNKSEIKAESFPELNRLAALLQTKISNKIEIAGHTDNIGTNEYNKTLSENRAAAVRNYLVSKGIPTNRFIVAGFGEDKPIASNSTTEGKAQNRRVELRLLK